ncbi:Oidioi.mRNA.OKI2018_I69.PAR.g10524.t1.cds [Oikopleura dioica]|uniref:Oidioi.mRNA.OKI2018_I69.PAR.g10524.t1.cds n=1 Tax=Oikopleura dioica TaxID=34765 RepID=A0ABN7RQZ5_OIKDI|nr:Oidioi.mRNA.OKI2018_I69.PAR.g10524.t1.cds [Oikopleura dioica]
MEEEDMILRRRRGSTEEYDDPDDHDSDPEDEIERVFGSKDKQQDDVDREIVNSEKYMLREFFSLFILIFLIGIAFLQLSVFLRSYFLQKSYETPPPRSFLQPSKADNHLSLNWSNSTPSQQM